MSSTTKTRPGFRIISPDELEERFDAVHLYPGITLYPVAFGGPRDGDDPPVVTEAYMSFAVGAGYPEPKYHGRSEIALVVYGVLVDEGGTYTPGTRIEGVRGSSHTPSSPTGCLLHLTYPEG